MDCTWVYRLFTPGRPRFFDISGPCRYNGFGSWLNYELSFPKEENTVGSRLTRQQELFKRTVREFAEKNIAPRSREIDQKAQGIPEEIIRGMVDLSLFGVAISYK